MTDIKTGFDSVILGGDYEQGGASLAQDNSLRTAVVQSLFTDRRALDDDMLPDNSADKRGWFGDVWLTDSGAYLGSRLWLLHREKQTPQVLRRAEEYTNEALQWLIDENIADSVEVIASNPSMGILGLEITISRPSASDINFTFNDIWEAENAL